MRLNNGRLPAILNLIKEKFVRVQPPLKPHILFCSSGLAIFSGFHDIPQNVSIVYINVIN